MSEIFLTRSIDNGEGYIDSIIDQISSIPVGEPLNMTITSYGGDIYQGDRLFKAILLHQGKTKATVIGLAASMAALVLAAFDEVETDYDSEIMLHKARIVNKEGKVIGENESTKRFNQRAYTNFAAKGVDKGFLKKVFLENDLKDFSLTAEEAQKIGLGKVTRIERRDGEAFKVAAQLNIQQIKLNTMGIFGKTKPVLRLVSLSDGRKLAFSSESEALKVGDSIQLVGSNELLSGKLILDSGEEVVVNEENEVQEIKAIEPDLEYIVTELANKVSDLEKSVAGIIQKMGPAEENETEQMKAKEEEMANAIEEIKAIKADLISKAESFKTVFKPKSFEDKKEVLFSTLSAEEKRAFDMRQVAAMAKNESIN